jgi:hypothetical protein
MAVTSKFTRGNKPDWMQGVGPYIGRVVNHLDTEYMGTVEVEILKVTETGSEFEDSGYFIPCTYVSPFLGQTPRDGVKSSEGFDNTQKSYGFWAVPPDVGVKVLIIMAENNYGFGFWIGCIQDKFMNFMMPGNAATEYSKGGGYDGKQVPAGEYNKELETGLGNDPTQYIKDADLEQIAILERQGLVKHFESKVDQSRGLVSSSARREVPSMVFGWSTPGPVDRRKGKAKAAYSTADGLSLLPFNRLGGTSFVMDDGDSMIQRDKLPHRDKPEYKLVEKKEEGDPTKPHNEIVRLRTRTGHQILMNNSEDFIHIINARGTSWIELTNNGKIDVYSYDSVSVHTEMDFNLRAKRDINIEASGNINLKAHEQMRMESGNASHWRVGTAETKKAPGERDKLALEDEDPTSPTYGDRKFRTFEDLSDTAQPGDNLYIDVSRDVYWKIGTHPKKGDIKVEVSRDGHVTLDRDFYLYAKRDIHQLSDRMTYHKSKDVFHQQSDKTFHQHSVDNMHIKTNKHMRIYADVTSTMYSKQNFITAMSTNHFKANSENRMAASTNHFLASTNYMSKIQQFGVGAASASVGSIADDAELAQPAILPECTHYPFIPIRIPLHEPYQSHENLDPMKFKPDKTDSTKSISDACEFSKQYEQEEIPYILTPDTFRKGS